MDSMLTGPWYGRTRSYVLLFFIALMGAPTLQAQLSEGGQPTSFSSPVMPLRNLQTVQTPSLDLRLIEAQDESDEANGLPPRFGFPQEINLDLLRDGDNEDIGDGMEIWRTRILCPGAISINLLYDKFWLPEGGRLYIYSEDRSQVLGAFTNRNNKGTRQELEAFATSLIYADGIVVEYEQPIETQEDAIISIQYAVHGYRMIPPPNIDGSRVYGSSGACQVNVNCSEGNAWQDEKKGVAMILVGGTRWCSGSLINNTAQDGDLLFLTAAHCLTGGLDAVSNPNATNWSFAWEYESPGCSNSNPGALQTTAGATLIANATQTDMALFRLTEDPRAAGHDVYFNGWNRTSSPGSGGVGIHHPAGDIKKIATHSQTPTTYTWSGTPTNSHWRVNWDGTPNGHSVTEGGSSGSPLFNASSHIIGQLHGGSSINCSNPSADPGIYGRLDLSWNGYGSPQRRLHDHLDPLGSAPNTLNGAYQSGSGGGGGCTSTISVFPYTEGFESSLGWTQGSGDDFDWTRQTGGTGSSGTGPTGAAAGSYYAYMEVSSPNYPTRTAILNSPCFNLSSVSNPTLTFQYHALGATVGTLRLEASTDGTAWSEIWSITGDQGSAWQSASVSLNAYTSATELRLRFRGTSGTSYTGDICVDDLRIAAGGSSGGGCTTTISSFPYTQTFDGLSLCQNTLFACVPDGACSLGAGWSNVSGDAADWAVDDANTPSGSTGPSADHSGGGKFLYTEASSCFNNTFSITSPCFDLSGQSNAELSFWYHMYGADMGSLTVQVSTNNGSTWSGNQFSLSGDQGNSWQQATVNLSSWVGNTVQLRFQGTTGAGYRSDIALDDVQVTTTSGSSCPTVDFSAVSIDTYGGSNDQGSAAVQDGGATLLVQNNSWKSISFNYNVTANTVIEFDFRSTAEGEIHAIGFDNDAGVSPSQSMKVHGTQSWGNTTYDNYVPSAWTSYTIPIGSIYTGSYDRLFFLCDKDATPTTSNSYFRNVKVYETSCEGAGESMAISDEIPARRNSFQVSPNPFQSRLDIVLPELELPQQSAEVVMYDLMGKEVYRQSGIRTRDLSIQPDVPAGVYLLQLRADSYVEEHKVIKMN